MRIQDVVDAVDRALLDEDVPISVREEILDCIYDILRDELGDGDDD